jgi:hypothetical protein
LIKLFQKFARVEAAEASSRSAERETLLRRFSFAKLFSCAYIAKRKADKQLDGMKCLSPVTRQAFLATFL